MKMPLGFFTLSDSSVNFEPINRLSDIFFDDVNKKVCTVRGGGAMGVTARGPSPKDVTSFRVANKGTMFSIKLSLDLKIVAIQRSPTAVVFVNFVNGVAEAVEYAQTCKAKAERIIGIEWTFPNEILFVTDEGLEIYQITPDKRLVRPLKSVKAPSPIHWFVYSPETQILVASTGAKGSLLQPYSIAPGNVLRMAKFEAEVGSITQTSMLALLDRDVCVATVYGLIYVMVMRHAGLPTTPTSTTSQGSQYESGSEVLLYLLQKENTSAVPKKQYVLQLGATGKFAIHVIDDLIVVHQQASKNSVMFDIRSSGITDGYVTIHRPMTGPISIAVPTGNISTDPDSSYDPDVELYAPTWVVFLPDLIIDARAGCMWQVQLNVQAICDLIEDRCVLAEFLLRRFKSKSLLLDVIRENLLKKRISLAEAGAIWDVISNVFKIHAEASAKGVESNVKVVIDQSDIHTAFIPLIDDDKTDFHWLSKVMLEYLSSLQQRDIQVQPFLHELLVKALVKSGQFQKLHQLVQYGVICSSKPLAFLLLSLEAQYPPSLQIAMDMLGRSDVAAAEEIVEILLSKQRVMDALRYAQTTGSLDRISPMKFVEAAWQTENKHERYTVFRYFEQRSLRLKGTPQFARGEQYDQYAAEFRSLWSVESNELPVATLTHNGW